VQAFEALAMGEHEEAGKVERVYGAVEAQETPEKLGKDRYCSRYDHHAWRVEVVWPF
jgi:hypothetical protein